MKTMLSPSQQKLNDALHELLNPVSAVLVVPALAEAIADVCLRAGINQQNRLALAQLAMEMITERLDQSGCFDHVEVPQ
jgi:hypothetical protein